MTISNNRTDSAPYPQPDASLLVLTSRDIATIVARKLNWRGIGEACPPPALSADEAAETAAVVGYRAGLGSQIRCEE